MTYYHSDAVRGPYLPRVPVGVVNGDRPLRINSLTFISRTFSAPRCARKCVESKLNSLRLALALAAGRAGRRVRARFPTPTSRLLAPTQPVTQPALAQNRPVLETAENPCNGTVLCP